MKLNSTFSGKTSPLSTASSHQCFEVKAKKQMLTPGFIPSNGLYCLKINKNANRLKDTFDNRCSNASNISRLSFFSHKQEQNNKQNITKQQMEKAYKQIADIKKSIKDFKHQYYKQIDQNNKKLGKMKDLLKVILYQPKNDNQNKQNKTGKQLNKTYTESYNKKIQQGPQEPKSIYTFKKLKIYQ